MSHIISFRVTDLAGRKEPFGAELNRDTNIFFGLNGSGKTSLLKILHAAMANETEILESVPFTAAEVKIYSLNWKKVFTRSIEKHGSSEKSRSRKQGVIHSSVHIKNEIVLVEEPTYENSMRWRCTPTSPKGAVTARWAHKYLPTSRLHISDGPFLISNERNAIHGSSLTEEELDAVFARSVEHLWSRYSAEVLSVVRKAQEQGLASILRAVLSPQSASNRRKSKLNRTMAYKRVHTFLKRQGSSSILGKQADFEKRYESNATLQDVVLDIDFVEDKIKAAMASRDNLQDLITSLFMANKEIRFTDE